MKGGEKREKVKHGGGRFLQWMVVLSREEGREGKTERENEKTGREKGWGER